MVIATILALVGAGGAGAAADAGPPRIVSLHDSLKPLRARFNQARGKHRFVALLSPT